MYYKWVAVLYQCIYKHKGEARISVYTDTQHTWIDYLPKKSFKNIIFEKNKH